MRPFLDSTDLRNDAESLRERMDADGFLYIRGLPKHLLEDVGLAWLQMLAAAGCDRVAQPSVPAISSSSGRLSAASAEVPRDSQRLHRSGPSESPSDRRADPPSVGAQDSRAEIGGNR